MKLLVLLVLAIAVSAVHLEAEEVSMSVELPIEGFCKRLLDGSVGFEDGKLVTGLPDHKDYGISCSDVKLETTLFDCTLTAKCKNKGGEHK
jgi:hypothetical protein